MELCATAERRWKHLKKKGRREPRRLPRAFVKAAVPEMQVRRNGRSFFVSFDLGNAHIYAAPRSALPASGADASVVTAFRCTDAFVPNSTESPISSGISAA